MGALRCWCINRYAKPLRPCCEVFHRRENDGGVGHVLGAVAGCTDPGLLHRTGGGDDPKRCLAFHHRGSCRSALGPVRERTGHPPGQHPVHRAGGPGGGREGRNAAACQGGPRDTRPIKKPPLTHWISGELNREASRLGDVMSYDPAGSQRFGGCPLYRVKQLILQ
ncbi:hypothetical protein [Azospirillum largimobile]